METTCVADYLPDFTGKLLGNGQYELTRLLGAGAAGVVYLAHDHHAPTTSKGAPIECAVKIIPKAGPLNSQTWQQQQEITLHKLVSDVPHVLTLYATFEDTQFFYLVMDCHEHDLFQLLCRDEFPYADNDELVRSVFVQILDAIHACHDRNVFHRDLKPENILCNADGTEVYIADFGLATRQEFSYTFCCGTSSYMSPECLAQECERNAYSARHGDIWALGILLINIITGLNPWEMAVTTDEAFNEFLVDDNHFERVLPISKGAIRILKQIFSINPSARPTIPELRERILALPTFFPPKKDGSHAPVDSDLAAPKSGPVDSAAQEIVELEEDIGTVDLFSYGLDDGYPHSLTDSPSTSSSGSESQGLITPDDIPQPRVDISGFAEDLGEALRPFAAKDRKLSIEDASPALNVLERLDMLVLE
ncbi:hypothetical protein EVJ58_g9640 [Rhodofomes roseus]|uniref:Protein kinase domain-containing protein n=1 Tax=Rhodofomes roseus TaxID=34475 RepID=A0A4Y9XTJ6_9APHY|nr:hypothetical protein EVJ58_g9640 [Rhodofomes roseus]